MTDQPSEKRTVALSDLGAFGFVELVAAVVQFGHERLRAAGAWLDERMLRLPTAEYALCS